MSLVQARWIGLAAAAAAAVSAPILLVQAEETAAPVPAPTPAVPEVTPRPAAPLSFALTAPPFDPDRTPEGAAPPADAAAAPEAAPPPPAALPTLVGIASRSRGRAVALVKGADGETVMLSPGRSIDGWRLVAIGRDQAVFEMAGARRTARLDFSNKSGAAPAPSLSIPPPPPMPATPEPAGPAPEPRN